MDYLIGLTESYLLSISLCFPNFFIATTDQLWKWRLSSCIAHVLATSTGRGAVANLLSVVDLPEEGLPTRPIRGSRGMFGGRQKEYQGYQREKVGFERMI
jgi:hypothetical protein